MTAFELIVISVVLAIVIIRSKSKKIKQLQRKVNRQSQQTQTPETAVVAEPKLDKFFQSQIAETKYFLLGAGDSQSELLNKRIEFLESEVIAYNTSLNKDKDADYWNRLCDSLATIIGEAKPEQEEELQQIDETEPEPKIESILDFEQELDSTPEPESIPDDPNVIQEIQELDEFEAIDEIDAIDNTDFSAENIIDEDEDEEVDDNDPFSLDAGAKDANKELDEENREDGSDSASDSGLAPESESESEPDSEPESESEPETETEPDEGRISILPSDLSALQTTIAEQNSELVLLQSSLDEKDTALTELSTLADKLKETEDAHVELNDCIESLEKENTTLQTQLQVGKLAAEALSEEENKIESELVEANNELELAQQTIDILNQDLSKKDSRTHELQQEVEKLELELQQKIEERDQLLQAQLDLSAELSVLDESEDPATLTKQIEELTDIIVKKSEALSALQQEDELDDAENIEHLNGETENTVDTPWHEQSNVDVNDITYNSPANPSETEDNSQMTASQLSDNMRELLDSQLSSSDDVDMQPPTLTNNQ